MASSLFGRMQTPAAPISMGQMGAVIPGMGTNPTIGNGMAIPGTAQGLNNQISNDAVAIAQQKMQQSGGDAKAAFYALAKEKGIDPNQALNMINSLGNPSKLMQNMLLSNPRVGGLLNLAKGVK